MKKTVLILCTLFFSMLIAAQKVKVEDSFEQLFFHAEKKFKPLMGPEISRTTEKEETNVQIKSKLELQPSVSNTVSMTYKGKDTTLYFNSTLSTHKTMAEADGAINAIVDKINKSGKAYKVKEYDRFMSDYPAYTVVRETPGKIKGYNVSIYMSKDKSAGLFNVYLNMAAKEPGIEYVLIDVVPNDAQICKDVRSVVEDGKNDFVKYKGELIKSDDDDMFAFLDTKYVSKIKLEGSEKCYIKSSMIGTDFVAELGNELSAEDAKSYMERAFSVLGNSLGKGYAYKVNADNTRIDFVNVNDFDYSGSFVNVAYIEAKTTSKGYNVALKIKELNKLFN
ncbi:MAG: hypothetical protein PHP99_10250 [Paludibacter sp.]|nr:hypothetical protein [Paludibacter sp.]